MIERTNTAGFERIPEGRYLFTVNGIPEKVKSGDSSYRIWIFDVENQLPIKLFMRPWESKDLLIAVGGEDAGDDYVKWDDEKVDGMCFKADLKIEKYKGNDGKEKSKYVLSNFKQEIPF